MQIDSYLLLSFVLTCCSYTSLAIWEAWEEKPENVPRALSQQWVKENAKFDITCDATKFRPGLMQAGSYFYGIGIVRKLSGELEYKLLAMYWPFLSDENQLEHNVPEGRKWTFEKSGGAGTSNAMTIKLIMHVKDGKCSDQGHYKCVGRSNLRDDFFYSEAEYLEAQGDRPPVVLSQTTIKKGGNFTMTCDGSKFSSSYMPPGAFFHGIGMVRKLFGDNEYELIAMYWPFVKLMNQLELHIPQGRHWEFAKGGGPGHDNAKTIKLVMAVNDGKWEDQGHYRCIGKSNLREDFFYSEMDFLQAEGEEEPTVLSQSWVRDDAEFSMTCDGTKFPTSFFPQGSYFYGIGMVRKITGQSEFELIAMYWPFLKEHQQLELRIPPGRRWEFRKQGGAGTGNKDTIKFQMIVPDGKCQDQGYYMCVGRSNLRHDFFFSEPDFLEAQGPIHVRDTTYCNARSFIRTAASTNGATSRKMSTSQPILLSILVISFMLGRC